MLAALVASGLSCDAFQFVGFLPAKPGQRQKQLQQLTGVASATLCINCSLCHAVLVHASCLPTQDHNYPCIKSQWVPS